MRAHERGVSDLSEHSDDIGSLRQRHVDRKRVTTQPAPALSIGNRARPFTCNLHTAALGVALVVISPSILTADLVEYSRAVPQASGVG